jgi:ferritin-like metal-binding protein YciE
LQANGILIAANLINPKGDFIMSLDSLADLFLECLKDTHNAERQLTKALPKMAKASSTPQLNDALLLHLQETQEQIKRLEQVFSILKKPARGKTCVAMEGLINEGKMLLQEEVEPSTLDAGLIGASQKIEHYEIAAYGTLIEWAMTLGYDKRIIKLLELNLAEEKATDVKLSKVAAVINHEAEEEPV